GFTNANNNRIFRVASSSGTTVVGPTMTLTDEAAPPAGAKLQAVGFQGAAGDLVISGLTMTSTLLDFTTLGLVAGEWLKIGGSDSAMQDSGRFAGATDVDAPTNSVLNTSSNVGRIAENGAAVGTPNYVMAAEIVFANNIRRKTAVSSIGAIGLGLGECDVTGK